MELFHEKERYLQELLESNINYDLAHKWISDQIDERASRFIRSLNYAFLSYQDQEGYPQIIPLIGEGIVRNPSPTTLILNLEQHPYLLEIFKIDFTTIEKVGLLFIDLLSRRRFRVNGIVKYHASQIEIQIVQAYTNCPKYIQSRTLEFNYTPQNNKIQKGTNLTKEQVSMIQNADTFFLGTSNADYDMDASHRGGNKGFVKVDNNVLEVPDYQGNGLYNSLGNMLDYPKVGLMFLDFENSQLLQISGTVTVIFNQQKDKITAWKLAVEQWTQYDHVFELQSIFFDASIYNL
ncbi:pyridoxamine 5'-phosphate oxidase family protein [Flammeovirga sp. EKP202]|uniref:pyridoxamine 5'-phosphate oxidase family protein n=1 Tax=Flammeovirga sp. EKP202 TaxID=2770592 RepID=UPI00165FD53D|nr:pyridoxamine 5'-phosphate oxidase family protein [Flammeovirga sp. EKP202]MBD0404266.1 pyridoxamine 5'-phosphate oxidase family protein [Flammeovirga sp. EKP202]